MDVPQTEGKRRKWVNRCGDGKEEREGKREDMSDDEDAPQYMRASLGVRLSERLSLSIFLSVSKVLKRRVS